MLSGFDGLNDAANLTPVLDCRVADGEILECELVPEGDCLLGASLQA